MLQQQREARVGHHHINRKGLHQACKEQAIIKQEMRKTSGVWGGGVGGADCAAVG